jgi:hypothetical protein
MIAPNVSGRIVLTVWREKHARRMIDLSPAVLSSFGKQYNNRRVFAGFSLADPARAGHLNGKHRKVKDRNRMAIETKEQL